MTMAKPKLVLLSVFGIGYLRPASGTWGSLPPVVLAMVLIAAGMGPTAAPFLYLLVLGAVLVAFTVVCVVGADAAEHRLRKRDPGEIVADETAGQCIPLMALPVGYDPGLAAIVGLPMLAFVAFRVMDIVKPPPANQLQGAPGGWGVVLDDLVAGFYALLLTRLVLVLIG